METRGAQPILPVPVNTPSRPASNPKAAAKMLPLFVDDSDEEEDCRVPDDPFAVDDGAILTLDEPRSVQKPIRRANTFGTPGPSTPRRGPPKAPAADSPESELDTEDDGPAPTKLRPSGIVIARARSATASPAPNKAGKAPRMTKKALQQLELARRRDYAQAFFNELNEATTLEWNKRLLTTAGRAHWKRTREGVHVTSIQLAEKILDCDERIRNTLSHEMCHLACWIIDDAPTENHGSLFKNWAKKVMRKRPDIEVTTKHNYDIKYKYEWSEYGRHSKSINPEEVVCAVCKGGQLVPQFESRRAAPKTPKPKADSQNAAARSRDSPLHIPGAFPSPAAPTKGSTTVAGARTRAFIELSDGEDSDVELLADTLKTVQL
ncbi:SprT-like family-domain-containing protein [Cerioporus squamosus]|nr:SprT-like family-domain-containing protein [Cerioporus squamosus]